MRQLDQSIRRFQEAFWDRQSAGRPPVGIINPGVFLPIKYLRAPLACASCCRRTWTRFPSQPTTRSPSRGGSVLRRPDPIFGRLAGRSLARSLLRLSGALLHGLAGARPLRRVAGRSRRGARSCGGSVAGLPASRNRAAGGGGACRLLDKSLDLRGPSDVIAAMRGQTNFFCDLCDGIDTIDRAAGRINESARRAAGHALFPSPAKARRLRP